MPTTTNQPTRLTYPAPVTVDIVDADGYVVATVSQDVGTLVLTAVPGLTYRTVTR